MFLVTAGAAKGNFLLIGFASLNMVVSLYYYLNVIKNIFMHPIDNPLPTLRISFPAKVSLLACSAGIMATGFGSALYQYIINAFN